MTCKTRCIPDYGERLRIVNKRPETDGSQWELILNFKNRAGDVLPLITGGPGEKSTVNPARQVTFNLPVTAQKQKSE